LEESSSLLKSTRIKKQWEKTHREDISINRTMVGCLHWGLCQGGVQEKKKGERETRAGRRGPLQKQYTAG